MHQQKMVLLSSIAIGLGALFFAYQQEWILIRLPQVAHATQSNISKTKRPITIYFWHENQWHEEKQDVLWSNESEENLFYLVTNWLNTLDAEDVTNQKVLLEMATLSPSGSDAYLSFDRNPFDPQWPIFEKWMWIEGLLKTINAQPFPMQNIYFLVNHKPLSDKHILVTHPWPISGFLSLQEKQLQ